MDKHTKKTNTSKMKRSGSTQSSGMKLKSTKTKRQKKLPSVSISEENWQLDIEEDGTMELGLGNWSNAGWRWTGDSTEMAGYLIRLASASISDVEGTMLKHGISFNDLKAIAIKNLNEDSDDGLYSLTGDNGRWHFGEGEVDSSYLFDDYLEGGGTDNIYSEEEHEKIYEKTWELYNTPSFEDFIEEHDYKQELIDALTESNTLDEFDVKTKEIKEDADGDYYSDLNANFTNAIKDAEKQLLKEKEIKGMDNY